MNYRFNVMAFPFNARGDETADDTMAIANADDAAAQAGGGLVEFPPRRYKITRTIDRTRGVTWGAEATRGGFTIAPSLAALMWHGEPGGVMVQTHAPNQNCPYTRTYGLELNGRNVAGTCYKFTGGKIDSGTSFERCQIRSSTRNALHIESGATNFLIRDTRFDQTAGYAIYLKLEEGYVFLLDNVAYDNWPGGTAGGSDGFLFVDGEAATKPSKAFVVIRHWHPEVNGALNVTAPTAPDAADQRGLIRLGINPRVGGSGVQHILAIDNTWVAISPRTESFSIVQLTGPGTPSERARAVRARISMLDGIGTWGGGKHSRLYGGVPPADRWPHEPPNGCCQVLDSTFAPLTYSQDQARRWYR